MSAASIYVDLCAARALARQVFAQLTTAQRSALTRARKLDGEIVLSLDTRKSTAAALIGHKLAERRAETPRRVHLTPEGLLVRAEGMASIREQAQRRYRRRAAT